MQRQLKQLKDQLYYYFAVKNNSINKDYHIYKSAHPEERLKRLRQLASLNIRYRILKKKDLLYYKSAEEEASKRIIYYRFPDARPSIDALLEKLIVYDVISFDIFDTAIYRKVDTPERIFYIMGMEMGFHDFTTVRKNAERRARDEKERQTGSREIVLSEIYDLLEKHAGVSRHWMEREIELELNAVCVNSYIHCIYQKLLESGKTIIFTSDMYLPKSVIEQMLVKTGYSRYEKLYLSNEYGENKGNGKLQQIVLNEFVGQRIIHIGDTENSDIKMSQKVGMDALYNRDARPYLPEDNMDSLAGSTYNAVINNTMNSGLWQDSLHYDHGYRIGGILVAGYCQHINKLAQEHGIEKILFCARDCDIVQKVYNRYFYQVENEYLQISRYAILNLCAERFAYDLMGRCIMRYMTEFRSNKTIGTILTECGYDYLVPLLEENSLDQFMFPQSINNKKIENFILDHLDVIREHNRASEEAAKEYYAALLGNANRILIVDIGWTGSCITALKYFLETHFPERQLYIRGTLACTSRNWALTSSVEDGVIDGYLYTPFKNMDTTRELMPGGKSHNRDLMDRLHIPMESLFTSKEASLLAYKKNDDGTIGFVRRALAQPNEAEIDAIQAGMMDFTAQYLTYQKDLGIHVEIPPYVAFSPFGKMLKFDLYCCAVYRHFVYDTPIAPFDTTKAIITMESLYSQETVENLYKLEKETEACENYDALSERKVSVRNKTQKSRLLFISPELIQTGSPRSLLRMCRVALALGYEIEVWSAKDGPFRAEFENLGIGVEIIPENRLKEKRVQKEIASFNMAICNTIVTDAYARVCSCLIPTVWYIREAANIPDFIMNNWERKYTLKNSRNIYCVSEYAAEAIKKFTSQDVKIVKNCVEDEIEFATDYCAGSGEKVKFVQFGTMEYRKGYDVLLAAYKAMPGAYRKKAELYFAGGFINSGTPYCSYLFGEMRNESNVHYLGVVRGEENKIRTLSEMDVVVVASRDESCSLVALEGAMLSKPLIVTENVGAKYMVDDSNGFIVKTADVESLSQAMIKMIDSKSKLQTMGKASRIKYEQMANMESYTAAMERLFATGEDKKRKESRKTIAYSKKAFSQISMKTEKIAERAAEKRNIHREEVIVSMTSHPARIATILPCIKSLLNQNSRPKKLLLWLAKPQFQHLEKDLPAELRELVKKNKYFEIRWTEDDLKPHKKYYYAMQEYPDLPVITVDDDVVYAPELVSRLMDSYRKFPDCVSCMRTNMIMFNLDGSIRSYDGWMLDYFVLKDTPSAQLLPTGIGGILYPPHAVPDYAFDKDAICETSLFADDLWLKVNTLHKGYKTVLVKNYTGYSQIEGTNESALWRQNITRGNNDTAMANILAWYDAHIGSAKELLNTMRKDRAV